MLILLAMAAARADCSFPDAPARYAASLERSRLALEAGELARFRDELGQLEALLDCLDEPVAREQAAETHRLMGAAALLEGRDQEALTRLQAALALAPPEGGGWLAPPERGWWVVDGARSQRYPERPYILQRADEDGRIVETRYMTGPPERTASPLPLGPSSDPVSPALSRRRADEGEPASPALSSRTAGEDEPAAASGDSDHWQIPKPAPGWLLAAGGSALVSGGLYAMATRRADSFYDLSTPQEELEALRRQTNTLVAGSAIFGTAAVGALGGAFVVRW